MSQTPDNETRMELAKNLREITINAQKVDDLPDYLASRILAIADLLPQARYNPEEIMKLADQVAEYDTYAQTGYLGMGVNHLILESTIRQIEEQLAANLI